MATKKHLPLLHNPLLNSIFNNPLYGKLSIKATVAELAQNHNDYAILVPPAHILQDGVNLSGQKLADSCYHSDDFMRSHIIKVSVAFSASTAPVTKVQLIIYNTMNGKQVLLKNGMVFTGKGFKKSIKLSICGVGHFVSFCDYFPKGSRFLVLYIEDALLGRETPPVVPEKEIKPPRDTNVTFEDLLRNFPVLSRTMADHFYVLFHHNNRRFQRLRKRQRMPLSDVTDEFGALVTEAFSIVQNCVNADTVDGDRTYNLLHLIVKQHASVDLNRLVHEYVELNIYDRVWLQLVFQYQNYASEPGESEGSAGDDGEVPLLILTPQLYKDLSCLSLNQLDIPVDEPWAVNVLYRRVALAIETFSKLSDSGISNQRLKVQILTETVQILTQGTAEGDNIDNIVIDADTLIGLLIMVVVHSKVPNLEAHLYYIRHFGVKTDSSDGPLNYILSNIDAVIYHLSGSGDLNHLEEMSQLSAQNYEFWYAIQKEHVSRVSELLDKVEFQYANRTLPRNHFLHSRNIHGESCFTFALRARNFEIFHALLSRSEHWILLEDILFDRNTSTNQSLLMLALQEEVHDITMEIIELVDVSATHEEQILYYNSRDNNGRTVGHYLYHDIQALEAVGELIDWKAKDANSHTPLFSLCRCYDHPDYRNLVLKAFESARKHSEGPVTYDDHMDKLGNTLLHVIAKGIPESGLLSLEKSLVDVNRLNKKFLSPIGVFVKYSRLENLLCLFEDKRLIFNLEDPKSFYNVLDLYSFSASRANGTLDFSKIEQAVVAKYFAHNFPATNAINFGATNARYDSTLKDWVVNIVYNQPDKQKIISKFVPLNRLRQFVKIQKLASPLSFSLSPETFWVNLPSGVATVPFCSKFRMNRVLEHLTVLLLSVNYFSKQLQAQFLQNFSQCCQDGSTLVLDFMKDVSNKQELEKNSFGEVKLSLQKIEEIEYFLNFSKTDLAKYQTQISKLNKLVSIGGVKQCDARSVYDRFVSDLNVIPVELEVGLEARSVDASYHALQPYILWIELCVCELLKNCNVVMDKLALWRQIYSKIKEINAELHRFEEQIVTHPNDDQSLGHSLSRRSTLSLEAIPIEDEESSSTFNFGFDNKKSRYRKLLYSKAEEVKKVMDLNVEIKIDHEAIAAEMSQFLSFRSGFMAFAIKQFTSATLVQLRHRQYELEKTLHCARS